MYELLYFQAGFMKSLFSVTLLCIAVAMLPAQHRDDSAVEQRLDAWQRMLEGKQWAAVADSCQNLLSERPQHVQPVLLARAWSIEGRALRQLGRTTDAIVAHRKALALRLQTRGRLHEETASSYLHIGNCLLELGRIAEAETMFQNSLRIFKNLHPEGHPDIGTVCNSLAQCYWSDGRLLQAERYLQSALSVAGRYYPPHAPQVVEGLSNLASFYSEQQHFDTAIALLRRAGAAQALSSSVSPGDKVPVLNVLASTYSRQGRTDLAVATWRSAAALCDLDFTTPLRVKGDCLHNLGLGLLDLGDYALAEMSLYAALNCFPDDPPARGSIFNGLGLAARYRNDLPTALRWFKEAQNAYPQAGHDNIPWAELAGVYQNLGTCYLEQGAYYPAKIFLQKSLSIFDALPDGHAGRLACRIKLSECFIKQAQPDSAAYCLRRAQKLVKNVAPASVFALYFQWGEWHSHQKNAVKALEFYQKAAEMLGIKPAETDWTPYIREAISINTAMSRSWKSIAQTSGRQAEWRRSLQYAQAATALFGSLQSKLRGQDAGAELQQEFFSAYDLTVEAWLTLGDERQAFAASEASKSHFLRKLSGAWELQQLIQNEPAVLAAERQCSYRLEYFQKRRFDLTTGLLPGQYDAPSIAALDDSIRSTDAERQLIRMHLGPEAGSGLTSNTPSVASLQETLSPGQTMLVYHWGDERLVLFLVRRDLFQTVRIPLSDTLTNQINRFFRICSSEPRFGQQTSDYEDFVRIGQELFRTLAGKAQPLLSEELLIVPDGLLWYVPFDALLTRPTTAPAHRFKQHPYMCREYHIQYLQSAGVWNAAQRYTSSGQTEFELLAVAPDFERNSLGLKPLQFNEEEAFSAGKILDGVTWNGAEATEEKFAEAAGRYRILLLSTHGQLNDRTPERSYVAFTQYPDSVENVLYVAEIYSLALSADLVVLSACQTASGKLYRGEGLMSISRAFQMAGARAMTASLWDVTDSKSPFIVRTFLEYLKKGNSKSSALARAQCAYLDDAAGLEAHPYYWAGFVSLGDNRAIFTGMKKSWLIACGIVTMLCFALMFRAYKRRNG